MYDVLNVCLEIIVALGQGYCLQYFLGSFLEGREKDRRIKQKCQQDDNYKHQCTFSNRSDAFIISWQDKVDTQS